MYTMIEPTMFISFGVLEILDLSLFVSTYWCHLRGLRSYMKEKEITLQVIIHIIMVDPHGHNDNIITLKSEGNSQLP